MKRRKRMSERKDVCERKLLRVVKIDDVVEHGNADKVTDGTKVYR